MRKVSEDCPWPGPRPLRRTAFCDHGLANTSRDAAPFWSIPLGWNLLLLCDCSHTRQLSLAVSTARCGAWPASRTGAWWKRGGTTAGGETAQVALSGGNSVHPDASAPGGRAEFRSSGISRLMPLGRGRLGSGRAGLAFAVPGLAGGRRERPHGGCGSAGADPAPYPPTAPTTSLAAARCGCARGASGS